MTRELERVLRATFEDRTQPVPQQSEELADVVIGRARGVRRRRAMAGGASALAVVVLAGLALMFGRTPPGPELPSGDNLPIPVIQGMDVAVPNPSDKSGPYLQAGDGTRVPLPKDEKLTDAVRVGGGYFAVTAKEEDARLAYYPLSGPVEEIADGRQLAMAVDAVSHRIAVTRADGESVRLDIYDYSGDLVKTAQLDANTVLNGWGGGMVMYQDAEGVLTAWSPDEETSYRSPPEKSMRFMGPTIDSMTYVMYQDPDQTCLARVAPADGFEVIGKPYCYGEIPAAEITVSPEGEWFAAHGRSAPDRAEEFVRTHLSQDLEVGSVDGMGSMANLGFIVVHDWVWETDDTLLYRTDEGWFRLELYGSLIDPLPIPAGSSAYPVPRAVGA